MEQLNAGVTDDGHDTPASFSDALGANYLGSPDVVSGLLAKYCCFVEDGLSRLRLGQLDKDDFVASVDAACIKLADIFSGRNPDYQSIAGWNTISLPARVQVELKSYWENNRAANGNDPLRTLFSWLCWSIYEAMSRTDDPDLFGIIMSGHLSQVKNILLGVNAKQQ